VLWVDRFGNAQLNVDPADLDPFGERVRVVIGESARSARRVRAFADAGPGEVGLIVDSYGLVTIVLDRRSAAEELGLDAGSGVRLEPFDGGGDDAAHAGGSTPVASPVRLVSRREPS
jgi:S-adenosylmethionine hydrolase